MSEEVENHYPGLHSLTACWKHEEEKPGGIQYAGSWGWVCPTAPHPCQQFPSTPPHGCQFQEATHYTWWCQQHFSQQVFENLHWELNVFTCLSFKYFFLLLGVLSWSIKFSFLVRCKWILIEMFFKLFALKISLHSCILHGKKWEKIKLIWEKLSPEFALGKRQAGKGDSLNNLGFW